jgi:3-hydroxyisobutyrate dehydrogenase-like beta-hydroxyacid dehydrogenase
MAIRLIDASHEVHVWNRSAESSEEVVRRGGHHEESPGDTFTGESSSRASRTFP